MGDRNEAAAMVGVAEAALHTARLNLDLTKVTAPISGRISRQNIDPGNMVMADDTVLTTIVSLDPIYAYFDVDERATLRFRRLLEAGKVKSAREGKPPVFLGLADEDDKYPHEGMINFVDNRLDPSTGTLRLRGIFDNHTAFLAPGMFVRIRVPIGQPHAAVLATERAIGSDQGQKFLYVLNDKNESLRHKGVEHGRGQLAPFALEQAEQPPGPRFSPARQLGKHSGPPAPKAQSASRSHHDGLGGGQIAQQSVKSCARFKQTAAGDETSADGAFALPIKQPPR